MLAMIAIVPTVAFYAAYLCDEMNWKVSGFDALRSTHAIFAFVWVVSTMAIWRTLVLWTLGRKWLTALITIVPFAQMIFARPLWNASGCMDQDYLRHGQHEIGIGLWVWLSIWVWWGWEKWNMNNQVEPSARPPSVSPTAKRLVASIGSFPAIVGAFFVTAVFLDDVVGLPDRPASTYACTATLAILVWIIIWRRSVVWSPRAVAWTGVSVFVLLAIPITVLHYLFQLGGGPLQALFLVVPIIGWGLWMALTVSYWPAVPTATSAHDDGPRCLKCGYMLKGLCATRCPECGDEPTLDELWAATVGAV